MAGWYDIRLLNDGNLINQLRNNGNGYSAIGEAFARFGAIDKEAKERKEKKEQRELDNKIKQGEYDLSVKNYNRNVENDKYTQQRNARIDEQALNEFKYKQEQDRIKNALEARKVAQTGQYYNYLYGGGNKAGYLADNQNAAMPARLSGEQLQAAIDMGLAHINDDGAIVMNNGANAKNTKKNLKKPVTKGIDWNAGF